VPTAFHDILYYLIHPPVTLSGYETCWGFLARTEPNTLTLMIDPVVGVAADEMRVRRLARSLGITGAAFPAPAVLIAAEGLAKVGMYPTALLEMAFPVSP
jgi:hypothetical protein